LVWSLPAALVITALAVAAFVDVLAQAPPPPAPKQVAMWIMELPPEPRPPAAARVIQNRPAPSPKGLPPPPREKPEPPPPPPRTAIRPEAKPPRPHRVIHREATRSRQVVPPAPGTPPSPPPGATRTAPDGVTMGARALYKPIPEIPEELRHHPLSLVAVARFRVAADGSADVELIQTTPEPRLNTALIVALKKWRFFPAMANGSPIASTIDIRIPVEVQ
jgi:protein TonB